jgi:hypothetical protein
MDHTLKFKMQNCENVGDDIDMHTHIYTNTYTKSQTHYYLKKILLWINNISLAFHSVRNYLATH